MLVYKMITNSSKNILSNQKTREITQAQITLYTDLHARFNHHAKVNNTSLGSTSVACTDIKIAFMK